MYWGLHHILKQMGSLVFVAAWGICSRSMWDLVPRPETEPGPLHWERGVLATGPPGSPSSTVFDNSHKRRKETRVRPHCMSWHWLSPLQCQSLSRVRLFVTPWTVARWAPLSMGFSRQEYGSGLPFLSPGGSSQPRDRTQVSRIASGLFANWATREATESSLLVFN